MYYNGAQHQRFYEHMTQLQVVEAGNAEGVHLDAGSTGSMLIFYLARKGPTAVFLHVLRMWLVECDDSYVSMHYCEAGCHLG